MKTLFHLIKKKLTDELRICCDAVASLDIFRWIFERDRGFYGHNNFSF